jgi:twitching motility protein PilT
MPKLDALFDIMLQQGASDLHLSEGSPPRTRLHGRVVDIPGWHSLDTETIHSMMREICDERRWDMFEKSGDMDIAYAYEKKARFRCNLNKQIAGYGAVFRTIPSSILTLEQLKVPPIVNTFADFSSGMVLVTGPTGSGKSTTLAAVIDHVNTTQARHILTIEEPIEFVHPIKKSAIVQREVHVDCKSFADGLHSTSRQDVDVILVGEMRDLETIGMAVTAAEMGVLVFGTLHTNSATKTVDRIIDVFPADQQEMIRATLAVSLRAVCAQLLLRTVDGKGRRPANEILIQTRAVSNYIREGKSNQLIGVIMSNRALGMQLMDDSIEALLKEGVVSADEAYLKALDKERFRHYIAGAQGGIASLSQ